MSHILSPRWTRDRLTRRAMRRIVIVAVAAAIVVSVVVFGLPWLSEKRAHCADNVVKRGPLGECIGVTDGSYSFAPHLKAVEERIREENERIIRNKEKYVSVAYMTSFTLSDDDSKSPESVRRELEGAYLAQYRSNRRDMDGSPKIRLLVANTGSMARQWKYTVAQLAKLAGGDDRLVAVAGLGPSTSENRQAMLWLSRRKLAMVGSTITATNLRDITGLVRVAPTNEDEARAASAFLKRQGKRTAVVVQDHAAGNLYAKTLGEAFGKAFPDRSHKLLRESMLYDSTRSSWKNELHWMSGPLCDQKPDIVYFAGRGHHLVHFLDALSNRFCHDQEFTVMTGDDTTNLNSNQIRESSSHGIKVLYTGLAHPDMWRKDRTAVSERSVRYFAEGGHLDRWFPEDPRDDGRAIMAHDAVLAVTKGIRMAANGSGKITGEAVAGMFQQMDRPQVVEGASGFISFANSGDPRNKAVPVLQLEPNGSTRIIEVSAPYGRPPTG